MKNFVPPRNTEKLMNIEEVFMSHFLKHMLLGPQTGQGGRLVSQVFGRMLETLVERRFSGVISKDLIITEIRLSRY